MLTTQFSHTGNSLSRNQVRAPNKSGWENQGHAKADEKPERMFGLQNENLELKKRQTPNTTSIINKSKARNQPRVI